MQCLLCAGGGDALRDAVQLCGRLQQPAEHPALAHRLLAPNSLPRQPRLLSPWHTSPVYAISLYAGEFRYTHCGGQTLVNLTPFWFRARLCALPWKAWLTS